MPHSPDFEEEVTHADQDMDLKDEMELQIALAVEIRKHPMGPVPKWGLYFYWGRGITRVGFNRPLYAAHVDASD